MDAVNKTKEVSAGKHNQLDKNNKELIDKAAQLAKKQKHQYETVNKPAKKKGAGGSKSKAGDQKSQGQVDNERGMRNFIERYETKLLPLFKKVDVTYVRSHTYESNHFLTPDELLFPV